MIMFGQNIQSPADLMRKVTEEYLYNSLRNPHADVASRIRQLRVVYKLDAQQYATIKRTLPYVVCGHFNPPYRRKENFAYTETFIVDIDHISLKGFSLSDLRHRIESDPRVLLSFVSPSEDGLKVMFRLEDRCYDAGIYQLFYKAFVRQFSLDYGLEQTIDGKTSDVSRACFVSIDPDAYYNPFADGVKLSSFVDTSNSIGMLDLKHELREHEKVQLPSLTTSPPALKDPDAEVMARIRERLSGKAAPPPRPEAYVPERLNQLIDGLCAAIAEQGVIVSEVINIQYAKKIRGRLGQREAEVNLFYGKRGFSVVISPRRGTDQQLNELLSQLIQQYIASS